MHAALGVPMVMALLAWSASPPPPAAGNGGEAAPQRLEARFAVGDVFPDFALPSLREGSPMRLSDFRGHKVMLHVFASW